MNQLSKYLTVFMIVLKSTFIVEHKHNSVYIVLYFIFQVLK